MKFVLRKWQMSDAKSLAANANNIRIWNNLRDYFPYPYSKDDGELFIRMVLINSKASCTDMAISVDGKAVGGVSIVLQTDVERMSAEIGYWLGEKYWGKGIMTEAVRQMVAYAFDKFPLRKIYAPVFDFNIASQRVLQKAGFEREAILRQAAVKNGNMVDLHYYSFIKTDK
jgi:RimJ/RimL family protein N-acetyltransferase